MRCLLMFSKRHWAIGQYKDINDFFWFYIVFVFVDNQYIQKTEDIWITQNIYHNVNSLCNQIRKKHMFLFF